MSDNTRIAKNTMMLYIRMLIGMIVSIYTSRIILQNLGIEDYGLYTVVAGVVVMFSFLNSALNSSSQRYLTIAIGKGDISESNKVFNIIRVIHFLLGLLIVAVCEIIGLWFINYKMTIPEGREFAVHCVFHISLICTFISVISIPYNALIIAKERMSAFTFISIAEIFCNLFAAYIISIISFDRLITYATIITINQLIVRFLYTVYCRKNFSESYFKLVKYEPLYKEIIIFASWGLLGHFSCVINSSIQNMMLNVFFTPAVNAARGIALQVSNAVNKFDYNFQLSVTPQITKSCALGNKERMFSLVYNSSRFSIYLVWILTLPILVCMEDILNIWLIEVPDCTAIFLRFILIDNLVNCLSNPLNMAIRANGIIKYPEIVGGITLITNLPFSFISLYCGCQPWIVFFIMLIIDFIMQGWRVYFSNKYLNMSILSYSRKVIFKPIIVLLLSSVVPFMTYFYYSSQDRLLNLLIFGTVSLLSVILFVYILGISSNEKKYLFNIVKKKIHL